MAKITNPIIPSDYPDVDVIRVEDTYYMVSTTMHFMPGAVILRSYDLGHWETISHIYTELTDAPAYHLDDGKEAYGQGMWAPCIRWHKGTFYVVFSVNDIHKTLVYTSDKITGPWEQKEIEGFYYDCSLLFDDDDRVYMVSGNRQIWLTELKEDLSAPKPGGLHRMIFKDTDEIGLGYEGSHIYKINGKYYVFNIHWPSMRSESCFVSDSLTGEFTGKDVLADDMGYLNQGVAQGGIVDTPDGKWYAVLFQDRGAVGRSPVLVPMHWKNDFPVFGINGKVPSELEVESTCPNHAYEPLFDGFSDLSRESINTEWNHIPKKSCIRRDSEGLHITTDRVVPEVTHALNTLTRRLQDPYDTVRIEVDASKLRIGDYAGIVALQSCYSWIAICRKEDGYALEVGCREAETESYIPMEPAQKPAVIKASIPIRKPAITLRMDVDFDHQTDEVQFYYQDENGEFVARGYNIMKGYYKMPKATANAIDKDGWLHTGDLACRTPDGYFRITGRLKDMIIRGGENIYPKEIEEFIYTHPKVKDVQVIGVPDEQYGEEIMACVILKDGETMTEAEMKEFINSHMARHKVPRYIGFVDSFPMNVAGKILKYKMREDAVKKLGLQKADKVVTA